MDLWESIHIRQKFQLNFIPKENTFIHIVTNTNTYMLNVSTNLLQVLRIIKLTDLSPQNVPCLGSGTFTTRSTLISKGFLFMTEYKNTYRQSQTILATYIMSYKNSMLC